MGYAAATAVTRYALLLLLIGSVLVLGNALDARDLGADTGQTGHSMETAIDLPYGLAEGSPYFSARGAIEGEGDIWYRLDVGPDEAGYSGLAFYLISQGMGTAGIVLYDGDGDCRIGECEMGEGHPRSIQVYLEEGVYYLRVRGSATYPDRPLTYGIKWLESYAYRLYTQCMAMPSQFDDVLYGCQTGPAQIGAESVWASGITGDGIKVALVDTGIDFRHEGLKGVVDFDHMDAYEGADGYYNRRKPHGTPMAGIIAAPHDHLGTRGIAPDARLYSFYRRSARLTDQELQRAMLFHHEDVAVSNNSWSFQWLGFPHSRRSAFAAQMETGLRDGFHGKGVSYVFSVGNRPNSNFSDTENFYALMAICGVNSSGEFAGSGDEGTTNPMGYGYNI